MALFGKKKKDESPSPAAPAAGEGDTPTTPPEPAVEETPAPPAAPPPPAGEYRKVRINPGKRGWGAGLEVLPTAERRLIYSVTGGGIHPLAQHIADLTGGEAFDGFRSKADFDEIAVAVIDCGGTARIGVYPMKGVLTVDVHGASPSGPLMRFITEENFVSGTTVDDVEVVE